MFRITEVSSCVGEIQSGADTLADKVQFPYLTLTGSHPLLTMQCVTENVCISITHNLIHLAPETLPLSPVYQPEMDKSLSLLGSLSEIAPKT
jgi:hypothetical protein